MRSRVVLILGGAVVAVGGALVWLAGGISAQTGPQGGRAAVAPAPPAAALIPTGGPPAVSSPKLAPCAFAENASFVYRAELTTDNAVRPRALMAAVLGAAAGMANQPLPPAEHVHATAQWDLHLRVARVGQDGTTVLLARYDGLRFAQGQSAGPATAAGDTAPPFLIQLNRRCAIERFGWRATADTAGARTQQSLMALADFALPERPGQREYSGTARDERGTYEYRAALVELNGGSVVAKRKISYNKPDGAAVHGEVAERVTGDGLQVRLAGGAWYEQVALAEARELGPGHELLAKSDVKLASRLVARTAPPIVGDLDDGGWVWGNLLHHAASARQDVDGKLVGIPLDAMLAKIAAMTKQDGSVSEMLALLAAWLQANPQEIPKVAAWIRSHGATDNDSKQLTRKLMAALGMSGLPAARAALREFALDKQFNAALRVDAAFNLSTAKNFDKADMAALLALSRERVPANPGDDIAGYPAASGTALLGAAARLLREQGTPEAAQVAIAELQAQLGTETDPQYLKSAIMGAGNAGDPKLLAALQPYVSHTDANWRLAAAEALRLMPVEATADLFATWLNSETHANVKQALVHAMWLQARTADAAPPAAVVTTAVTQLNGDQQGPVRDELVALLGVAAKTNGEARQALVALFRAEMAKGANANAQLLALIGQYVDAAALMGAAKP